MIWPSCLAQGCTPSTDAGEEMALIEGGKVASGDIFDTAFVNFAIGDQAFSNKFAQPGRSEGVKFVVVSSHNPDAPQGFFSALEIASIAAPAKAAKNVVIRLVGWKKRLSVFWG
jgi:hypothetical protein